MTTYLIAAPLAFMVGVSLGLLGGGGSILAVPILVYLLGMEPKSAIATSLIVVGLTSLVGALRHGARGRVHWKAGLLFGGAGVIGASVGCRVAALQLVSGSLLMLGFAALMISVASLLLRRSPAEAGMPLDDRSHRIRLGVTGVLTGALTGLFGAGGGFIIVPSFILVGRLPVHIAVGTSLLVIALNCGAGLLGFLGKVPIRWGLGLAFATMSIAGSWVGASLATRIRPARLRRAFGVFVLLAGLAILLERLYELYPPGVQ